MAKTRFGGFCCFLLVAVFPVCLGIALFYLEICAIFGEILTKNGEKFPNILATTTRAPLDVTPRMTTCDNSAFFRVRLFRKKHFLQKTPFAFSKPLFLRHLLTAALQVDLAPATSCSARSDPPGQRELLNQAMK